MENFNPEEIKKYAEKRAEFNKTYKRNDAYGDLNTNAILYLFDKNYDGTISKKEFENVTKEQYEKFIEQLNKFNDSEGFKRSEISYQSLVDFIDDKEITFDELAGYSHSYGMKNKNLKIKKDLKDSSQMSSDEIIKELKSYQISEDEINSVKNNRNKLINLLNNVRKEIVIFDEGSENVDWEIGTFKQGRNNLCTFLAYIGTFSKEDLQKLYKEKTAKNGLKYYEVIFPQDINNHKIITVTESELNSGEVSYKTPDGTIHTLSNLSKGDPDVLLLEMAFIKRFGDRYYKSGLWPEQAKNLFSTPEENKHIKIRLTPEDLANLPKHTTVCLLDNTQIKAFGVSTEFTLPDGRTGKFLPEKLILSDGTEILRKHSFSVRRYDKKTKELIITGNDLTNTSELRIPDTMAPYFISSK